MYTGGLATTALSAAWAAAQASPSPWTFLDTEFAQGETFGLVALAWKSAEKRPPLLHYVALLPSGTNNTEWGDLGDGFHRIVLQDQRISLTLCIGAGQAALEALRIQADWIVAGSSCNHWDRWWMKALARSCRRGTQLYWSAAARPDPQLLQDSGFQWPDPKDANPAANPSASPASVVYAPRWQLKTSRRAGHTEALRVGSCAVVGAGLCGGAVAQALALRGWQVTVYDQHAAPAAGASGLPAGLVVPHVSADDSPRSRLSRSGTRLLLEQARRLLKAGQDWQQTGVLEMRDTHPPTQLWHPQAGWVKAARLVAAWLAQPGIAFVGAAAVHRLQRSAGQWVLQDAHGAVMGHADLVVLANAHGCAGLIESLGADVPLDADLRGKLQALQQLHGTLSVGPHTPQLDAAPAATGDAVLPQHPVNGNGSFLPGVPGEHGLEWLAGATYETDPLRVADVAQQHRSNADKLLQLLPESGPRLMPAFEGPALRAWSNTRCVTHDRMPLVGPLELGSQPSVWICAGMGSRGLSFVALCAQLLAARMGAEPLPVEAALARCLDVNRARRTRP